MNQIFHVSNFFLFLSFVFSHHIDKNSHSQKMGDSLFNVYNQWMVTEAKKNRLVMDSILIHAASDSMTELKIRNCNYQQLPDIARFNKLKVLDASNNLLGKIRRQDLQSDSLQTVIFTRNRIRRMHIPKDSKITSVILESNNLKRFPRSLKRLKHLETLNVSHNKIKRIPRFIATMDSLKEINLNYNQVMFNNKAARRLANVKKILLGANNIVTLPDNINELKKTERLNFGMNHLSTVPPSFARLTQLKSLIFYKNDFTTIPGEIFSLKNLVELDFYYNQLDSLPQALGNLTLLKQLFLSYNNISVLPDTLRALKNLKYFYIRNNSLLIIPGWFKQLQNLERIGLDHNKIFSIPDLSVLPKLKDVDLGYNNLEYLPWNLIKRTDIHILILRDNPFIMTESEKEALQKLSEKREKQGGSLIF